MLSTFTSQFLPARKRQALLDGLRGSAATSGTQKCFKVPLYALGGFQYYKMIITGQDTFTTGGLAITYMETFYSVAARVTCSGETANVKASTKSTTGFTGIGAANTVADWEVVGVWREAI